MTAYNNGGCTDMALVKIDGKDYDTDNLSDEIKAQLNSMQFADAEIQRLNIQLAIAQTARNVTGVQTCALPI